MDVVTIARATIRRWYAAFPVLVATVLLIVIVMSSAEPIYRATTTGVVVGPSQAQAGGRVEEVNPFSFNSDALRTLGFAVIEAINSRQVRNAVAAAGYEGSYEATLLGSASFVQITVEANDQVEAGRTLDYLIQLFKQKAAEAQEGTSPERQFTFRQILDTKWTSAAPGTDIRLLATIGILGLAAAIALAVVVDRQLNRRAARQDGASGAAVQQDAGPKAGIPEADISKDGISKDKADGTAAEARHGEFVSKAG